MSTSIIVDEQSQGQRLDVLCTTHLVGHSRSAVQKAIKDEKVLVNGIAAKTGYVVRIGDVISIAIDAAAPAAPQEPQEPLSIPILYEDHDVVVINKPAGIAAHAGVGLTSGTIADWFHERYPNAVRVGEEDGRPGIVHRLDKDTSGVMILAKNEKAYLHLKKQFKLHRVRKEYLALVFGAPGGKDGRITRPIARSRRNPMRRAVDEEGKEAVTHWQIEKKFGSSYALIRVFPLTGRMHQIRVHLHFLGYPIVGDQLYTFKRKKQPAGATRQLLHAEKLMLQLPNEKKKVFTAPLPDDFQSVLTAVARAV